MKKLCNILISSLICGLLLVGYSNAMTYTVEGNSTKIAIPEDKCEGVTIKRCTDCEAINFTSSPECTGKNLGGVDHIECSHTYDSNGTYTVTVTPTDTNNTYSSIYISEANVKSITNFNGFTNVSSLYLNKNPGIEIGNSTFNSLNNGVNIYLENNELSEYSTSVNVVSWLSLQHNNLTTIPPNIWNAREGNYIELSNEVKYGLASSSTKKFYLSDNKINFVGITKVNNYDTSSSSCTNYYYHYCNFNNETSYDFEWFGFSYNTTPLTYDYEIEDTNISEQGYANTGVTINQELDEGNYTFKVCIHNSTEYCDTFNFEVEYDEKVSFKNTTKPNDGDTISSINDIEFYWQRSGNYPEQYLSGYTYTLKKGTSPIIVQSTPVPLSTESYILDPTSIQSDPSGTYTFTIELVNYNGTIDYESRTFTIQIDDTITIEKPRETPSYTGAGVTTVSVPLKWSTTNSLFSKYSYYITTGNTCSSTQIAKSDDNITNKVFDDSADLGDGEYLLCITMYASNGNSQGEKSFSVNIPSTIKIISPENGKDLKEAETTFSWEGFTPYTFTNYTYELLDEHSIPITQGSTGATSFKLMNLSDGSYTFNVTLNDNSGKTPVSTGISFTVSSNVGTYINIISPELGKNYTGENVTGVELNFQREGSGTLFSGYNYSLKKGSEEITSGYTNNKTYSFPYVLPSGSYTLYIDMLNSEKHVIKSGWRTFNVVIPTTLNISKPIPGLQTSKDIEFNWTGFAEFFDHYQYTLSGWNGSTVKTGQDNISKDANYFNINNLHHGQYRFTVNIISTTGNVITGNFVEFSIFDDVGLATQISQDDTPISDNTLRSRTGTFSWYGQSEDFSGYYYSITGTTFTGAIYEKTGYQFGETSGSTTINDLSTGKYKFTVKMLSGPDKDTDVITGKMIDFNVAIPASLTITSPSEGAKIESATATVSWTGYNDTTPLYSYMIKKGSTVLDTSNLTDNTSFTRNDLSNGSYSVTVYMLSGWAEVATKTVNFTVDIPVKPSGGGGSSSKSHPTNNLKLSIGNESPSNNEWIELIVKIDEKYTGKVTFPKIQYYSGSKWIDIPVTSKNYISDYSDDAKLGYVKFSSDDDGKKNLSQFIKFAKNGHYRIYAEDKDGYDTYVQLQIGPKKVEVTTGHNAAPDTDEEIYIARSCKKYTIIYSDTLNIYTSPNLNISEFFMNKDYLKRYLDSKNRYQSGCPTNIGWITTSYVDRTNDDERYTAPNGKVYFIVGEEGDYYSNELNRELKTPTSFKSIQELKFYIRDRNPLINMAALGPVS